MSVVNSVNIRPGVNVLAVLPHLNYKPWFALAEFVDNSIQSYIDHKKKLQCIEGKEFKLVVEISFDTPNKTIVISDNAAGIFSSDYQRAFRPAEIPPNATGLSEFGMGMKSAACWFAPTWSVRSSALGERVERTVIFDIEEIVHDRTEELNVLSMNVAEQKHYTEIRLENIRRFPRGKTIQKIKEHLASIYRAFTQESLLSLVVDGEELVYEPPAILMAQSFKSPNGEPIIWKKNVDIDLGEGKSATGFVAIREVANTRLAGLALFRRKRLIMGSADETYRPEEIFGRSNTYPYQRIFGEIHLKGFFVSHTKDGVKWEESEDEFLKKLRKELLDEQMPLLQQAREHRAKQGVQNIREEAVQALNSIADSLNSSNLSAATEPVNKEPEEKVGKHENMASALPELDKRDLEKVEFKLFFRSEAWLISLELSYADDNAEWLSISSWPSIKDPSPREVVVRVSMLHAFMTQFPTLDESSFKSVLNIAAAMALAEVVATELADKKPSSIRRYTNEILKNQLARRVIGDRQISNDTST